MSNNCIFHIITNLPKITLNQVLQGDLISDPHQETHPDDLEAGFAFIVSNDLYQKSDDGWLEYTVKSKMTGTIYKVKARKVIIDFALWEGSDDVYERHEINAESVIEIQQGDQN